jgi:single-stranded DNA-binding protein
MLHFKLNGRLAADPQFSTYGADDRALVRLRVASNNPNSAHTDFFDVTVFGDAAASLASAGKGDIVRLQGIARQNTWTSDDGARHERVQLVGQHIEHTPRAAADTPAPNTQRAPVTGTHR